ncbi:D-2-hydroxyacid dehydrogenase [Hyphomonas johnsonii]|uniref:D-isomer specific 2-hydroxyacid dehydrogenase family protein n=1 Tax=Hyphomonas johnsonii MHS-2 TaxID=1280950 RepID=A0A059FJK0_9PROT|nr:D-2-hydroxyacid dehydrogenase [Hyphomonas johnsonii]KCZ90840.1 D-isomer specific 2-hydroxyacid dehydrogenase family protein [Hyphomonas johnsonii MHS-2]
MKDCLVHAKTFARIAPRLKSFEDKLNIIVMDDSGAFANARTGEAVVEPKPEIAFGNADAFFGPSVREFVLAVARSDRLDWFQSAAAGIENPAFVMIGQAARTFTTNHTQSEAMAEWALWQALDFFRQGPKHRAQQAAGHWERHDSREIRRSKWLIVGFGSIGASTGRRVMALGGEVTGVRRSQGLAEGADRIVPPDRMMAELPGADVVLVCLPHTPETEGMANADFFAAMKPDALFMNLGRGALVDEAALMAALDAGRPAHAALDVASEEPLPRDNPLWSHPGVTLTPHDSPQTQGTIIGADDTFIENLHRYFNGEPLHHLIDKAEFAAG